MRRMTFIMMALAMVLGFTQCKKDQLVPQTEGVRITLTVDAGDNNSRVIVDPTGHTDPDYATVTFENGDLIYVGNNGAYCGYLQYSGTQFSGTVNPTSEADYLHFYFMGNKGTTSQPTSVNITDQTSKYPVISYARSTKLYKSGVTAYSAKLQNYCAIVKFTTTDINADITITDMNNTVTVNFAANNAANGTGIDHNPYTPSKAGNGEITLHRASNTVRWAILLPQSEVTAMAYATGYATQSAFTVPAVTANMYHNTGVAVNLVAGYFFQVSASKVVQFSSGNLQYKSGSGWRFAPNQYDYIGAWNTANYVDLFGWGTWGSGKDPLQTSGSYTWSTDFQGTLGGHNDWRTLTSAEWSYVFNSRTTPSGHRYVRANVCGKNGVILLPNNWSDDTYTLNNYNTKNSGFGGNSIDVTNWNTLESAGCVFLTTSGNRNGTNILNSGSVGYYWSSTNYNASYANCVYFSTGLSENTNPSYQFYKYCGCLVRLVR